MARNVRFYKWLPLSSIMSAATSDAMPRELDELLQLEREHNNTTEFLMAWETHSALYGTTNSPWDLERTPGGSSGAQPAGKRGRGTGRSAIFVHV